jgi:uncharacterized membrane protein YozB (DUF420 family)
LSAPPLIATIDVIVQLILLAMLIAGFAVLRRKRGLKAHGALFALATLLNLGAIIVRMVPSFLDEVQGVPITWTSSFIVMIVHMVIGTIAEALALIIVLRWVWNRFSPKGCYAKGFMGKGIMNMTFVLWLIALLLGLVLYGLSLVGS